MSAAEKAVLTSVPTYPLPSVHQVQPEGLDSSELSLQSVEGERLLKVCEDEKVAVTNDFPFISVWVARERETSKRP